MSLIANRLILALVVLPFLSLFAQNTFVYKGKVQNTEGEPVAFAAILPNEDVTKGVLSDIEGRFVLTSKTPLQSLTFRCIGFQTLRLESDVLKKYDENHPLSIVLKNADNLISEVTISAGENPADRIIRRVVTHRDKNNPEKLTTFQCKTYNKVSFEGLPNDSAFSKILNRKDSTNEKRQELEKKYAKARAQVTEHQAFIMETVTERRFRFPNDNFERVLLNRVSGFNNSGIVALANMIQPFSFYGDYLRVLDKNYVNPISIGSPSLYFFNIEDTLYQGIDTVFLISFHPRKGRVFEGLTGVLHINTNQWAVQNVKAKPSNPTHSTLKLEQQYHFVDSAKQWFPEQLNFELDFPKYPAPYMGMRIVGRSYISDVTINPPLKQSDFNLEAPLIIEKNAHNQPESAWLPYRKIAPLSMREQRTYEWVDSVGKKKNFTFWSNALNVLASGKLPIKNSGISLDLNQIIKVNNYENTRLGLGFTNAPAAAFSRPKFWESSIYAGYGLRDSAWKYGANLTFRLSQSRQMAVRLGYMHDIREAGAISELDAASFVSRSVYANRFDTKDELSVALNSRLGKRLLLKMVAQEQFLQPNYAYRYIKTNGESATNFHFTEWTTYAKFVYNEQNPSFLGENINEINKIPVFELAYTQGFDNILSEGLLSQRDSFGGRGRTFSYQKWLLAAHQSRMIRRLGRMIWRIEAGMVKGDAPMAKLFTLNQSGGGGLFMFYVPNTFQTLQDSVAWLSDRFVNVYFSQAIGNILYTSKYSSPQLTLAQNASWGQLSRPEAHQNIAFTTPSKPLIESGIVLDNLLKINYVNFANIGIGASFFYRWGMDLNSWRSFNPRLSFKLVM
ncbi:MAG: carboxypeptidase-like regulatory domain-containing protein [Saprospiraceae bacterium]|nr:carboxypeptidase-like regulatory domain-containing protein [Saprospiraceae bacterium]